MKNVTILLAVAAMLALAAPASGSVVEQWATSSTSSSSYPGYEDATGAPDQFTYADSANAWSPSAAITGVTDWLQLLYATSVYVDYVMVRMTYMPGTITQIDLVDESDVLHTIWSGATVDNPGVITEYEYNFTLTSYKVKGVKVSVDGTLNRWDEIDAVKLGGDTVPEPATLALLGIGGIGVLLRRRKR